MKYTWLNCFCGKSIHPLDMPKHFQSKHVWPNEDERTKKSSSEEEDEAGSSPQATT
jgi:hypothetical protein